MRFTTPLDRTENGQICKLFQSCEYDTLFVHRNHGSRNCEMNQEYFWLSTNHFDIHDIYITNNNYEVVMCLNTAAGYKISIRGYLSRQLSKRSQIDSVLGYNLPSNVSEKPQFIVYKYPLESNCVYLIYFSTNLPTTCVNFRRPWKDFVCWMIAINIMIIFPLRMIGNITLMSMLILFNQEIILHAKYCMIYNTSHELCARFILCSVLLWFGIGQFYPYRSSNVTLLSHWSDHAFV